MAKRKQKRPDEMTTDEALKHVFPPEVADALREAVTDPDDPTPDAPKPRQTSTKRDDR